MQVNAVADNLAVETVIHQRRAGHAGRTVVEGRLSVEGVGYMRGAVIGGSVYSLRIRAGMAEADGDAAVRQAANEVQRSLLFGAMVIMRTMLAYGPA